MHTYTPKTVRDAERHPITALVTGATSGIGYELALALARRGNRVVGVGRDPERCRTAAERIRTETANPDVFFEIADLSRRADVRALASRIATEQAPLDVVIHNAGTFTLRRILTTDNVELQFAVNYLAGFMVVALLFARLAEHARVMMISSGSHRSGRIHWGNLSLHPVYNGLTAYSQSKLAEVMFCYELARRFPRSIDTYAVDPGLVDTEIGFKGTGLVGRAVWALRSRGGVAPQRAAEPIADLAVSEKSEGRSGLYWCDGEPVSSSRRSYDADAARRLWELSERLTGVRFTGARV